MKGGHSPWLGGTAPGEVTAANALKSSEAGNGTVSGSPVIKVGKFISVAETDGPTSVSDCPG